MDNANSILTQDFYNTIFLDEAKWKEYNEKSFAQQKQIEFICSTNIKVMVSGWLMKRYLERITGKNVNINSVRRCLSNLKNADVLLLLTGTRIGEEGKPEHYYIWKIGNENRLDIKKEKFQMPTVADFATAMSSGVNRTLYEE